MTKSQAIKQIKALRIEQDALWNKMDELEAKGLSTDDVYDRIMEIDGMQIALAQCG